jgi:RimJ/RimL family protein N-acetyltransferase
MRHSFAPFEPYAVYVLSHATGIDFGRTNFASERWLCVTGREDDGRLMGCCCFEFVSPFEAYFNIVIIDPRCITRRVMRAMFAAVFSRVVRITAEVDPNNEKALRAAQRMGFVLEGYKRKAIEGRWDAVQLGMLEDTCQFLRARPRAAQAARRGDFHEQHPEGA